MEISFPLDFKLLSQTHDLRLLLIERVSPIWTGCESKHEKECIRSEGLKCGNATYTPGLSERQGTTGKFTHKNALGSADTTQAVTDSMLFDAFGMTVSSTGTTPKLSATTMPSVN